MTQLEADQPPPCEEAAVLHSAGFSETAIALLRAEVECGGRNSRPWIMLLELYRATQQRVQFDLLLEGHERVFGAPAACTWHYPPAIEAPGTLPMKGAISSPSRALGMLAEHGNRRKTLAIDMSEVERIEYGCLHGFATLLRDFAAAGKRVIVANIGELNATLLETVGVHRQVMLMRRRSERPERAVARSDEEYRLPQAA